MRSSPCRKAMLILSALLPLFIAAQNVGVGTVTPYMKLHVSSPSDTALLLLDNNTPLDVNTSAGIYIKNGSYFTGAIKTTGTGTAYARLGFFTYANAFQNNLFERLSVTDAGDVGIGTITPSARLEVNGNVKITGGSPGDGKVLTSDAAGLASWQAMPGAGTGFKAIVGAGGFNVTSDENTTIIFTAKEYDDVPSFFSTAFITPSTGLYHFDALVNWNITSVASASQYVLVVSVDGIDRHGNVMQVPAGGPGGYRTQAASFDMKLTAGQSVSLYVLQTSGIIQTILGSVGLTHYSYFSGRRVY